MLITHKSSRNQYTNTMILCCINNCCLNFQTSCISLKCQLCLKFKQNKLCTAFCFSLIRINTRITLCQNFITHCFWNFHLLTNFYYETKLTIFFNRNLCRLICCRNSFSVFILNINILISHISCILIDTNMFKGISCLFVCYIIAAILIYLHADKFIFHLKNVFAILYYIFCLAVCRL